MIMTLAEQSTQNEGLNAPNCLYSKLNAEQLEKVLSMTRILLEMVEPITSSYSRKKVAIEKLQAEGSPLPISEQVRTELDKSLTMITLEEKFTRYTMGLLELNRAVYHAWDGGELNYAEACAKWQYIDFSAVSAHFQTAATKWLARQSLWDKLQSIKTEPDEGDNASTQLLEDEWEMIEHH